MGGPLGVLSFFDLTEVSLTEVFLRSYLDSFLGRIIVLWPTI